jgi:very-short-patch-repair endonuclease
MIPYRRDLKDKARILRSNMTPAERKLWYEFLRLQREQWYRQKPLLDFIVDFYCPSSVLVVELDGDSHLGSEGYDHVRTERLRANGLRVLRFGNDEVLGDFPAVCGRIAKEVAERISKSLS